jgi:hypothetical protein
MCRVDQFERENAALRESRDHGVDDFAVRINAALHGKMAQTVHELVMENQALRALLQEGLSRAQVCRDCGWPARPYSSLCRWCSIRREASRETPAFPLNAIKHSL